MAPETAAAGPADRPVFAFTIHRSGSTLLGRLLNCHPDLVVWGEHSGVINDLAKIDYLFRSNEVLRQGGNADWNDRFAAEPSFRSFNMQPWTIPNYQSMFGTHARGMIRAMFAGHLQEGQRWGFKEIRYHRPYVAKFLVDLFPAGKFVLLQRDVVDSAVSNILAAWSQHAVKEKITEETATEIVRDTVYALLAFQAGFKEIKEKFPRRCFWLTYDSLRSQRVDVVCDMFRFLGFSLPAGFDHTVKSIFETRFNETRKQPLNNQVLTPSFIKETAARLMPELQQEIAADGVDTGRLVSESAPGKYSFIVGTKKSAYMRF